MIPYGRQDISEDDIQAVVDVLRSDFLTQGPMVKQFEERVASYCGVNYGVAVNSATSALHIACLALGVGTGDRVWTSPITFVASANCALYCGASVDFVDIDAVSYNMSVDALRAKLEVAKETGLLPKVVVPVHLCGQSCDMKEIHALSLEYGFTIIEDASHAIGASYMGRPVGNCQYSDVCIFSFHPVKIITTAEGGVAVTSRASIAEKMRLFASHGITRDPSLMTESTHGDWYYQQVELGFNYRMTELQAALGISQFTRLNAFVDDRNTLAERYDALLQDCSLVLPKQASERTSSRHLYVVKLKLEELKVSRKEVFTQLREAGVGVNLHYVPVHTQPYYQAFGFSSGDFPEAENYYESVISIPLFAQMSHGDQDFVVAKLKELLV